MAIKWHTRKDDMLVARDVLIRHFQEEESGDFGVEEVTVVQEGSLIIERSDWVVELEEVFQDKYGEKKGLAITNRVITELITTGKSVH